MGAEIFIDTSGFYALLVQDDEAHEAASRRLRQVAGKSRFLTTDYVLDETATLLKARGLQQILKPFFETVWGSAVCRVVWMEPDLFRTATVFFLKHADHGYSFTDCVSFVVMKKHRLKEAMTKDSHFREAGFDSLL